MESKINYFLLLLVIVSGVAIGNLLSNWISVHHIEQKASSQVTQTSEIPKIIPETTISLPEKVDQVEAKSDPVSEPRETVKLSPKDYVDPELDQAPANSEEMIEKRKLDENGLRLSKKCNEWTIVHKDMNTASSERGMNKHCSQYYDYISFGTLPNTN